MRGAGSGKRQLSDSGLDVPGRNPGRIPLQRRRRAGLQPPRMLSLQPRGGPIISILCSVATRRTGNRVRTSLQAHVTCKALSSKAIRMMWACRGNEPESIPSQGYARLVSGWWGPTGAAWPPGASTPITSPTGQEHHPLIVRLFAPGPPWLDLGGARSGVSH